MQMFKITISGGLEAAGIPGPKDGLYRVQATTPATALKRLLDGGEAAGYKFATVGHQKSRLALKSGQKVAIVIERI